MTKAPTYFSFKKKILFSSIILIMLLFVLEIGSRIIYFITNISNKELVNENRPVLEADSLLEHRWIANNTSVYYGRGIADTLVTNSQHWVENYTVEKEKPKNVFRIFYLGDSNTQCVVNSRDKMVEIVEDKLNTYCKDHNKKIEVINTGTSSYSIFTYYLIIKNIILSYSPDLVIINVDMTDVPNDKVYKPYTDFDADSLPLQIKNEGQFKDIQLTPTGSIRKSVIEKIYKYLKSSSRFIAYTDIFLAKFRDKMISMQKKSGKYKEGSDSANWLSIEYNEGINSNIKFSMHVLGSAIDILKTKNIPIIVTGVPHYPQFVGEWSTQPHELLKETVNTHGGLFLNSFTAIRDSVINNPKDKYYWEVDPTHFNIAGNRLWASVYYNYLIQSGILPPIQN